MAEQKIIQIALVGTDAEKILGIELIRALAALPNIRLMGADQIRPPEDRVSQGLIFCGVPIIFTDVGRAGISRGDVEFDSAIAFWNSKNHREGEPAQTRPDDVTLLQGVGVRQIANIVQISHEDQNSSIKRLINEINKIITNIPGFVQSSGHEAYTASFDLILQHFKNQQTREHIAFYCIRNYRAFSNALCRHTYCLRRCRRLVYC